MSKLFTVSWVDVKRSLTIGLLTAILAVILVIFANGSIFGLDLKNLIDVFGMSVLGFFGSYIQSLLTTEQGNFVGAYKVE